MKQEYFEIEQIDRYLEKQMSGEELKQYELGLFQSEELKTEVSAYQQLIEGLSALNSSIFQQKIHQWEKEWSEISVDDSELIEWYIEEELESRGKLIVEERIATDKIFAKAVKDQQALIAGFAMVNSENFIQKLESNTSIKKSNKVSSPLKIVSKRNNQSILRKLAATFLLIIAFGGIIYWYANQSYNSTNITANLYEAPRDENIMGDKQSAESILISTFTNAHQLMEEQHYDEAFLVFNRLLNEVKEAEIDDFNRRYLTEEAEWNRLLAAHAMNTPPLDIELEANRIAGLSGHSKQKQAQELLEKMHTFWYRIAN